MQIPTYKPELPPYELVEPEIRAMYASGMLYPGKYTRRLETQVKNYTGVNNVVPVSSCSMGLILMLNTLWPRKGAVIVPSFTFNATLQAVEWNNLTPIVVDVDMSGQLRPDLVEDALKAHSDVLAVVPVHMWGNACYPGSFEKIRMRCDVPVFFDGAHVFGTTHKGRDLSHYGTAVVYSIAATKPVSAGEGGLVVTRFPKVADTVYEGATHGLVGSLDTRIRGTNGKIQEFNSILAYHAIERFELTKKRRAEIVATYHAAFAPLPLRPWSAQTDVDPSYKDYVIFVESSRVRERLEEHLNRNGIGTKRYFYPAIPDMGSFRGIVHSADQGRALADVCLALPLYPSLTNGEVEYIISKMGSFYG